MIAQETINDLLNRADIVGVINKHVPLKKYGREYRASCPFHTERTPSFYVIPQKQFYHCFGCGASGNAISFLMNYSNLRFTDAVKEIAAFSGMTLPVGQTASSSSEESGRMIQLLDDAHALYERELVQSGTESEVKSFLKTRKFDKKSVLRFGIGFVPDQSDFILRKLGRSKTDRDLLYKAGLIIRNDKRHEFDRFQNRLMFPIYDRRGRVIAFCGRALDNSEPKYAYPPQTSLFNKRRDFFGLFHAAKAIRMEGKAIIVDGYMDVLRLHQAGIENAVSTPGAETTTEHVRELFHATDQIVFCFDKSRTGCISAYRSMLRVLPEMQDGRLVGFSFLPERMDQDSFVQQFGAAEFQNLISDDEPIEGFMFRMLREEFDVAKPEEREELWENFNQMYRVLPDTVFRRLLLHDFCRKLVFEDYFGRWR